jgi:S-methylmethionine-dependent homocysteine/selenocysteine methylase
MTAASDELTQRLSEGEVMVIDGGMNSELQARGVPLNYEAPGSSANLDYFDVVREVHEDYIRAGADIHITNTHGSVRFLLDAAGCGEQTAEIHRRAVQAALNARERVADRQVFIAGSMSVVFGVDEARRKGNLGPDDDAIRAAFAEQASLLADAGVDLLILELAGSNWLPGLQAAVSTGLPVWIGPMAALAEAGEVLAIQSDDVVSTPIVATEDSDPFGTELNRLLTEDVSGVVVMHTEVETIVPALKVVAEHFDGPYGAYPHVGDYDRPNWIFTGTTPDQFATHAVEWVEAGAQLVGGCCGTRPEHIRAIKERVPARVAELDPR